MRRTVFLAAVVLLLLTIAPAAFALDLSPAARAELEALYGNDASFALLDESTGQWTRINAPRCAERFTPCSTFKVPHALIALAEGVVPERADGEPDLILEWDRDRDPAQLGWPEQWQQTTNLGSAIRYSVVWYFQELARRIGPEREQYWLDAMGYGNKDISGGIDVFWLSSSLRISADEQVECFRKLFANELPFAPEHMGLVRGLILREANDSRKFWGKTGSGMLSAIRNISLFTGVVEKNGTRFVFALSCEGDGMGAATARRTKLLERTLAALGLDR